MRPALTPHVPAARNPDAARTSDPVAPGPARDSSAPPRLPMDGSPAPGPEALPDPHRPGGLDLAAYLLTRPLRYGPVPALQRDRLLHTQQALEQVRRALPLGRANVDVDVIATGGAAAWRGLAVSTAEERIPAVELPEDHLEACALGIRAGAVEHFGAGVCDDHAALGVATLAPHLQPGEALSTHVLPDPPHAWAERVMPTPEGEERIVIDAWAEGPAILAEDGAFSAQPEAIEDVRVTSQEAAAVGLGRDLTRATLSLTRGFGPAELEAQLRSALAHQADEIVRPGYSPMPVLSPLALFTALHRADRGLAQRAAVGDAQAGTLAQLDAAHAAAPVQEPVSVRDPLRTTRNALAATGVARGLGASVAQAITLAGPIEQAARTLRTRVRFPADVAAPEIQMATARAVRPTTHR